MTGAILRAGFTIRQPDRMPQAEFVFDDIARNVIWSRRHE
jgi:hypothetical protein